MKVGLLSWIYAPEARRGSERLIRDLADGLIARGHEPVLVTSVRGRPGRRDEDGLDVRRQWRLPQRPFLRAGLPAGAGQAVQTAWAARRGGFDVLHAFHPGDAVAAAHARAPSVFLFQGVPDARDWHARPRALALVRHAARRCSAVTVNSRAAASAFEEHTGVAARVIHPGVDLHAFTPGGERARVPTIFCPADPGDPRKAVGELIEAVGRLRERRPDAELVLLGTGVPATPTLPKGSEPWLRVGAPTSDRAALARLYRQAWVTVLPAYRESFGLVLAESLACGTPVLARDDAAGPEIVDRHGIGATFADGGLESALDDALDLPHDPAACRARAEDFSIDRCVDAYLSLYREISTSAP